jgi:PAS domain S-box-containing protein
LSDLEQQSLFEIVMAVGNGTDFRVMLQNSLSVMIRKLGCNLGAVVHHTDLTMEIVHSIPYHIKTSPDIIAICQRSIAESTSSAKPLLVETDGHTLMAFTMPGYGVLVLGKIGAAFSKRVMGTLVRIADKLATACIACEQAQIIKEEQQHFQLLEARSRFLFNNSPMPIWVIEVDSLRFLNVNDRAIELYGFTREEFSQMSLRDIRPKEDIPEMERLISHSTDGKITGESRHKKKDGTIINVAVNSVPIMYDNVSARIGLVRDITERKIAENELRIAAIAFESQEGMMITNADQEILRINRAFTQITGYTPDEVIGMNPRIFSSGRQDKKFYTDMWENIKESGAWNGEIWNKRKNGEVYSGPLGQDNNASSLRG